MLNFAVMKLLLVAATLAEIQPVMSHFSLGEGDNEIGSHQILVIITGIGMVATAFLMGKNLAEQDFDLAINAGIAGSFDRNLQLGEVVSVTRDCFAELGAEDDKHFLTLSDLGFGENSVLPIQPGILVTELKAVSGITVNRVHGCETTIQKTSRQWQPQIESMEGAAFFYACNQLNIPALQLRAISNYVEKRNRDHWNIGLAIKNLNEELIHLLTRLQ